VIEEFEMEAGMELLQLARGGFRKADGGNAELRGEVALPKRPRRGDR
jgi:hypothetical protein